MGELYGLLGEHLGHSYSKFIHEEFGFYKFDLKEVPRDELDAFMKAKEWNGINVGIPYKSDVLPYCTHLADSVKKIGATNTIKKLSDGSLYADNTDYYGFDYMAKKAGISFAGKKVTVFGRGGGSKAICAVMKDQGADVLAVETREPIDDETLKRMKEAEILVNATPVGMYPNTNASIIDFKDYPNAKAALDIVYNPVNTRFIQQAEELGLPHASGLSMLVAQAKRSCEIYMDTEIPNHKIEEVLKKLTDKVTNIVLIGMPGSGKSRIARQLSEELGMKCADTDEMIKEISGFSAEELIEKFGEPKMREFEKQAAEELCKRQGYVIATGGGIVTDPSNRQILRQNGKVVWINRNLEKLATKNRPLSKGEGAVEKLWEQRQALYKAFCDISVDNNETVGKTLRRIKEALGR